MNPEETMTTKTSRLLAQIPHQSCAAMRLEQQGLAQRANLDQLHHSCNRYSGTEEGIAAVMLSHSCYHTVDVFSQ